MPALFGGEASLPAALAEEGIASEVVVWDSATDWTRFDAVVLRQTWDYYRRPADFSRWLESLPVPVFNSPACVMWNLEKTYLRQLAERDIPVLPTHWVTYRDNPSLWETIRKTGWQCAVVKPVVSVNSFHTIIVDISEPPPGKSEWPSGMQLMVQPFAKSIQTEGEWTLVYFGGELSHTVVKRPAAGDFRVQPTYGGTTEAAEPQRDLIAAAERCLERLDFPWLYARVDLVRDNGVAYLMELELIEPYLYMEFAPESPRRFARSIAEAL